jgi:hypothetical protein
VILKRAELVPVIVLRLRVPWSACRSWILSG